MKQNTRNIIDRALVIVATLLVIAVVIAIWPIGADAGIMAGSEAALARDYGDAPMALSTDNDGGKWWHLNGSIDLFWWLRKTKYVLPPLV